MRCKTDENGLNPFISNKFSLNQLLVEINRNSKCLPCKGIESENDGTMKNLLQNK